VEGSAGSEKSSSNKEPIYEGIVSQLKQCGAEKNFSALAPVSSYLPTLSAEIVAEDECA
jgi:hypothetical protein